MIEGKLRLLKLLLLMLFAVGLLSSIMPLQSSQAEEKFEIKNGIPGIIFLDDPNNNKSEFAGDRGLTKFDHTRHANKDSCVTCHHTNSEKLTGTLTERVSKCTTCHKGDDSICELPGSNEKHDFLGKTATFAKLAYHGNDSLIGCIGCHQARNIEPLSCNSCHSNQLTIIHKD